MTKRKNLRSEVTTAVYSVFSTTRICKRDSDSHNAAMYEALARFKMPRYMKEYAQGMIRVLTDSLYRDSLVHGAWIKGAFYSTHRNRHDYYERNGIDPAQFAEASQNINGHFFADDVRKVWFQNKMEG